MLKQVPTTWDETIVLDARVSDYIVIARRSGDTWYLGAMTDWDERDLVIDLYFLEGDSYQIRLWKDGVNADRNAEDFSREETTITSSDKLHINLAPGGGFAAIISRN